MGKDYNLNPILEQVSEDFLKILVEIILKDGNNSLKNNPVYRESPEHPKFYTDVIADEIRRAGGWGLANATRKGGPAYSEVVSDVAKKINADIKGLSKIEDIEERVLTKLLENVLPKISATDKDKLFPIIPNWAFLESVLSPKVMAEYIIKSYELKSPRGAYVYQVLAEAMICQRLDNNDVLYPEAIAQEAILPLNQALGDMFYSDFKGASSHCPGVTYQTTIPAVFFIAYLRKYHKQENND